MMGRRVHQHQRQRNLRSPLALLLASESRVLRFAPRATKSTELPFTGLRRPEDLAVDTVGNVYVVDSLSKKVLMLPAG
jgi:hypothetical protein